MMKLWEIAFWRYLCLIFLVLFVSDFWQHALIITSSNKQELRTSTITFPELNQPITADEVYKIWYGNSPEVPVDVNANHSESVLQTHSMKYRLTAVFKEQSNDRVSKFGFLQPLVDDSISAGLNNQPIKIEIGTKVGEYTVTDIQLQQVELKTDTNNLTLKVFNQDIE